MKAVPTFVVTIQRVPAPAPDLSPLADALLSLDAIPVLDSALALAHDLTEHHYQQRAIQRSIQAAADELRDQLNRLEAQLQRVA